MTILGQTRYELDTIYRVYDNQEGTFIDIREDRDGLGLIEFIEYDFEEREQRALLLTLDQADLIQAALGFTTLRIATKEKAKNDS